MPAAQDVNPAATVVAAEQIERFRREVRLARLVTHRNVARTCDIGEHRQPVAERARAVQQALHG